MNVKITWNLFKTTRIITLADLYILKTANSRATQFIAEMFSATTQDLGRHACLYSAD